MNDLLAARSQMAMSLAFHIIFAAIGVAMPLLMVIAEWRWLRSGEEVYLQLAKRWAKGTAILFAVCAEDSRRDQRESVGYSAADRNCAVRLGRVRSTLETQVPPRSIVCRRTGDLDFVGLGCRAVSVHRRA